MIPTETVDVQELFTTLEDDLTGAAQYLSMFIDEAEATLDELIEALLALEAGGGQKNVEQLFVSAHRLKGSAASIGLNCCAKLAHLMEDLLQALVDKNRLPTPPITDSLLSCVDGLRQYVRHLGNGQSATESFSELAAGLIAARATFDDLSVTAAAPTRMSEPAARTDDQTARRKAPGAPNVLGALRGAVFAVIGEDEVESTLIGEVVFEPGLPAVGLKARLVYEKLSNLGNIRYFDPPADDLESLETLERVSFGVASDKSTDAIRRMLWVTGIQQLTIEPLERRQMSSVSESEKHADAGAKPAETLRVDIDRLDALMNLAGQLAIGKARLAQVAESVKKAISGKNFAQARDGAAELFEAVHLLGRVTDGIQQGVMNMRMLPIGPLFNRFHRVIRDLTRANGKDIRLQLCGESTELDKRMIDELGDPLIHMVRNAADHGIESPEVRLAAGKPAQGTITLSAVHRGSNVIICVSDDGRGLDARRIREKAVSRRLVSPADAERMTPEQLYQLIWLPGLSTAEKVTEVSGRGVGMDVVHKKIEELNGSVEIDNRPGQGLSLTLKLPLTLAILPSLMIEVDADVFAIPLESVLEIVSVRQSDINTVQGRRMANVRDRAVPILSLAEAFIWRQRASAANVRQEGDAMLVIVGENHCQVGLAVHRVLGEEDVVIKSIADNYRNIAGIAGASILGDGRVSLILDPHALIEMSSRSGASRKNLLENAPC